MNYLVRKGAHRYFLRRRNSKYSEEAQVAFDHALMAHLAAAGIRGPDPIPAQDGRRHVRRGKHAYELHRYLDGKPVDWSRLGHLQVVGTSLRQFHQATLTFAPPIAKDWPRDDAPERIRRGLAELRQVTHERAATHVLDTLERWTDRIERCLSDSAYWALPSQIIHGDFHPGNVHVSGQRLGIFDLDCASRQPRIRDLADGILYFCARRDGPFDASNITRLTRECRLEPDRNRVFLDSYGPLDESELEALPWIIAARWLYSRVHGRRKLPKSEWPVYATTGVLAPLTDLEVAWQMGSGR